MADLLLHVAIRIVIVMGVIIFYLGIIAGSLAAWEYFKSRRHAK